MKLSLKEPLYNLHIYFWHTVVAVKLYYSKMSFSAPFLGTFPCALSFLAVDDVFDVFINCYSLNKYNKQKNKNKLVWLIYLLQYENPKMYSCWKYRNDDFFWVYFCLFSISFQLTKRKLSAFYFMARLPIRKCRLCISGQKVKGEACSKPEHHRVILGCALRDYAVC